MKKTLSEILIVICISFTIISLIAGGINAMEGRGVEYYVNTLMCLLWTTVAILSLYSYSFFDRWPAGLVMLIQYAIAQGVVFGIIWISGFFETLSKTAYVDGFRSFTMFYLVGAAIFYAETFKSAKKAGDILNDIKELDQHTDVKN